MSLILGFKGAYGQHDSSISIIDTEVDEILYVGEEERFNGRKFTDCFPIAALHNAEKVAGIKLKNIEYLAICFDSAEHYKVLYGKKVLKVKSNIEEENKKFHIQSYIKSYFQEINPNISIIEVSHHNTHAATAFYCSQYKNSAIFTADGFGERNSTTFAYGIKNKIYRIADINFPISIGHMYTQICNYLGFLGLNPEGTVMALAGLGEPTYIEQLRDLYFIKDKFSFMYAFPEYFSIDKTGLIHPNKPFTDKMGKKPRNAKDELDQDHYNIAASIQLHLEEIIVEFCQNLYDETKSDNLCVGGGVFLNSIVNNKILDKTSFKNIYIHPASSDSGNSIGAALYVKHHVLRKPVTTKFPNVYLGHAIEDKEVEIILNKYNIQYTTLNYKKVASLLKDGAIIGWARGRAEIGPRALGNRSIIASPCYPGIKDKLNKLKRRQWFRPLAPIVMEEFADKYFEIKGASPYMLKVCDVKEKAKEIPAVVHLDNTARIQTVNKTQNESIYKLLSEFNNLTGTPVLINTSFNLAGESIVNNIDDALLCFLMLNLNYLVIGNFIVKSYSDAIMKTEDYFFTRANDYKQQNQTKIDALSVYFSSETFWTDSFEETKKSNG